MKGLPHKYAVNIPRLKVLARMMVYWRYALPDFMICGAMKAGTSSLFHLLDEHPQLKGSRRKEVHYFDGVDYGEIDRHKLGPAYFQSFFPPKSSVKETDRVFEATPAYFYCPHTPQRMHEMLPDLQLILMLRNPTDRAISHYFHSVKYRRETRPIMEALKEEELRFGPYDPVGGDENNLGYTRTSAWRSYRRRGHYLEQLKRFLEYYPLDRFLILKSESFYEDPIPTLQEICRFLGVDDDFQPKGELHRHRGVYTHEVPPEVVDFLDDYFRPLNQALYDFLGRDFGWESKRDEACPP